MYGVCVVWCVCGYVYGDGMDVLLWRRHVCMAYTSVSSGVYINNTANIRTHIVRILVGIWLHTYSKLWLAVYVDKYKHMSNHDTYYTCIYYSRKYTYGANMVCTTREYTQIYGENRYRVFPCVLYMVWHIHMRYFAARGNMRMRVCGMFGTLHTTQRQSHTHVTEHSNQWHVESTTNQRVTIVMFMFVCVHQRSKQMSSVGGM